MVRAKVTGRQFPQPEPYAPSLIVALDQIGLRAKGEAMTTTLTRKGQVALPASARKRLGLKPGAKFACLVQGGGIMLVPAAAKAGRSPP